MSEQYFWCVNWVLVIHLGERLARSTKPPVVRIPAGMLEFHSTLTRTYNVRCSK